MKPQGTIVIDEMVVPVRAVWIADGAFMVEGEMRLQRDLPNGYYEYRVHSEDGQLVFTGHQRVELSGQARQGDSVTFTVRCEATGKVAEALA